MSHALVMLKSGLLNGTLDMALFADAENDFNDLKHRADKLEELLIIIVRTAWPWDEDGNPNAIFHAGKGGLCTAMLEARDLLGLNHLSAINRTEPRT